MNFDFRLQVFHTVARRLNFTKAAAELFITQPAVTKHIQELEQQFGTRLFERNGSKVKLTDAGQTLFRYTEQLFTVYRNLEFEMSSLAQRNSGHLRLGASTTVAQYVLPPVLAAFRQQFRDVEITLAISNTEQVEHALQNKEIELGIIEGRSTNKSIQYKEFLKDEIVLVSAINNPLAQKGTIKPEELKKLPLLLREPGSGTLEVIAHALQQHGIKLSELKTEIQLGSSESIKNYLLHSSCMAFLSVHAVLKELQHKECCIIDVKGLNIERYFYFALPHGETEPLPALFLQFAGRYNFR